MKARHRITVIGALALIAPALTALQNETDRQDQLRRLRSAVGAYDVLHPGKLPTRVSQLVEENLVAGPAALMRPGSTAVPAPGELDARSDYTFDPLPGASEMVIRERVPLPGESEVLAIFKDGTIRALPATGGVSAPTRGAGLALPPPAATLPAGPAMYPPALPPGPPRTRATTSAAVPGPSTSVRASDTARRAPGLTPLPDAADRSRGTAGGPEVSFTGRDLTPEMQAHMVEAARVFRAQAELDAIEEAKANAVVPERAPRVTHSGNVTVTYMSRAPDGTVESATASHPRTVTLNHVSFEEMERVLREQTGAGGAALIPVEPRPDFDSSRQHQEYPAVRAATPTDGAVVYSSGATPAHGARSMRMLPLDSTLPPGFQDGGAVVISAPALPPGGYSRPADLPPPRSRETAAAGQTWRVTRQLVQGLPWPSAARSEREVQDAVKAAEATQDQRLVAALNDLAGWYRSRNKLGWAQQTYFRVHEIQQKRGLENHPELALTYNDLGVVATEMGDLPRADTYLTIAQEIWERRGAGATPTEDYAVTLHNHAVVKQKSGLNSEAARLDEMASAVMAKLRAQRLP